MVTGMGAMPHDWETGPDVLEKVEKRRAELLETGLTDDVHEHLIDEWHVNHKLKQNRMAQKSGFEMCFGPSTMQNTSRIQNKVVYATFDYYFLQERADQVSWRAPHQKRARKSGRV